MRLPDINFGPIEIRTLGGRFDMSEPYMHQAIFGRLRFHWFVRGDEDPDPHDHPWEFWTFPLTGYEEEVTIKAGGKYYVRRRFVRRLHWHHRPATYLHRVIGRAYQEPQRFGAPLAWVRTKGPILTIVWTGPKVRAWGFLKARDGRWCWQAWKDYVLRGGKNAPCE